MHITHPILFVCDDHPRAIHVLFRLRNHVIALACLLHRSSTRFQVGTKLGLLVFYRRWGWSPWPIETFFFPVTNTSTRNITYEVLHRLLALLNIFNEDNIHQWFSISTQMQSLAYLPLASVAVQVSTLNTFPMASPIIMRAYAL